ncbi:type II toxin-antitoxin system VapC family toxin [Sphingobium sp. CAP-1]|uniref:type II toxin-antitoxin system VapC family toxin n=1 Tax=Sphingobium sp. CAP-1 TaxID=2676077 RepID=UPI0012BB46E2|nr:PIN domain nuclease [Sphingobium sp. CAP-1]QGP78876.1 VapC toxin family PIN domain ribonuclease [Sphingobium sp. CAP-1]
MILVDSGVWIDYFRGVATAQTDRLDALLGVEPVLTGDLILAEMLQGCRSDCDFDRVRHLFASLDCITIGGEDVAIEVARNFRHLRALGVTVRKTIASFIATRCIRDGHALLYSDRDFDPFVAHLGLRAAL